MEVIVMCEQGYQQALTGLALRKNKSMEEAEYSILRYANLEDGHDKFLESMVVWLDVTAPRYFWQQFDKIRIGVSTQSESTMHTLKRGDLKQENFEGGINDLYLRFLNKLIEEGLLEEFKKHLPESFLQRRIVCTDYKTLKRIVQTRDKDKLIEWKKFINCVLRQLSHSELIMNGTVIDNNLHC